MRPSAPATSAAATPPAARTASLSAASWALGAGSSAGGAASTGSRAESAESTSVIIPVRLSSISLRRRSRVMSRGEPGGRLNPRALSALASASMLTVRAGLARIKSWTTLMISS